MILTQENRKASKQETEALRARNKMSEKQVEKLRAITDEDKIRKQGEERFAAALTLIAPTAANLQVLIARCSGDSNLLERRVTKLLYWIRSRGWRLGYEISNPSDIAFLSALVPDETTISDTAFTALWTVKKAVAPKTDVPETKYCLLGRKCLKRKNNKAGIVIGRSGFCSFDCRGRSKIIQRHLEVNLGVNSVVTSVVTSVMATA